MFDLFKKESRHSPTMWDCTIQPLNAGRAQRFFPRRVGSRIRYSDVLRYWREDETFRSFFISVLSADGYSAYRWETPPITKATVDREFEFVLLDAPGLDRPADVRAFDAQFRSAPEDQQVLRFPNLGKDAVLVVPRPIGTGADYAHLAAFMRKAPEEQKHELWRMVGIAMEARLSSAPVWLSTAGMGVPWLHVRLDSSPKYYGFSEYREMERPGEV